MAPRCRPAGHTRYVPAPLGLDTEQVGPSQEPGTIKRSFQQHPRRPLIPRLQEFCCDGATPEVCDCYTNSCVESACGFCDISFYFHKIGDSSFMMVPGPESNLHTLYGRGILSSLRLPIPPPRPTSRAVQIEARTGIEPV